MFACETYRKTGHEPRNGGNCEKQENKENEQEEEEQKTNQTETTAHCAIAWLTAFRYYY